MEAETTDRRIYRRRPMRGLTASDPHWMQLGDPDSPPLSGVLALTLGSCKGESRGDRLFLCGSLEQMSREFVEEPIGKGWEFARPYIHKFRSPVYREPNNDSLVGRERAEIGVKLVGESWLPGCEDMTQAIPAWNALKAEWAKETSIPLLSTPSKTGQEFLHENLPKGVDFPSLPDELATMIRAISPQHRLEVFRGAPLIEAEISEDVDSQQQVRYGYDGRWMYAGASLADRLPIGEPRKVGGFEPFTPGWYRVRVRIPLTWNHIGLLPEKVWESGEKAWIYPSAPGLIFETWAAEPELTLAVQNGWEILDVIDGYAFDKGRPLATWAKKLIGMRERLQDVERSYGATPHTRSVYRFAAGAIREILNHTIGSFHVNTYEREGIFAEAEYRELIAQWGYAKVATLEKLRGGKRRVSYPARHTDKLSIYMPHWSATIWALERAWIAKHALICDPSTLVEIRGDCIYSTAPLSFPDDGHYSQLRRKE